MSALACSLMTVRRGETEQERPRVVFHLYLNANMSIRERKLGRYFLVAGSTIYEFDASVSCSTVGSKERCVKKLYAYSCVAIFSPGASTRIVALKVRINCGIVTATH
ncbi:hypothetical protein E2C01_101984 [Portunus trituberculatus]|uniref:Uncharacterized protein n=1 Tax=Portunus trituberculatus TaxID=210409 RepID=A0A5B7KB86_PORTR|nr:hypothetical protein [Portunus trituberculatus]